MKSGTNPSAPGSRTSDYEFELPPDRIAQTPLVRRDASRLMVVNRESGAIAHRHFTDLADLIGPGDALVLNTTRVVRARLLGRRENGAPGEVLLLRALGGARYEAMVHPGGKLRPGRVLHVAEGLDVAIEEITDRRTRIVRLIADDVERAIERYGHVPLPPYIARPDGPMDAERYQTVFARESGSAAAPTAGLHFTAELLARIEARGARIATLVLHVGAGTFKPVEAEDPEEHVMHEEWYSVSDETASLLDGARAAGGQIWAVGTTVARVLESTVTANGRFAPGSGETRIFIRPPHPFRGVDKLITNFHLPRSTLIMLVAAFAGYELTMRAYREAIAGDYRFYSYGDAMAVV